MCDTRTSCYRRTKRRILTNVKDLCEKEGIVLIFDEVVSGFRFHPKGAQYLYGVTPHLSTFGKAMANGFSISALVGKKEIMKLGGLDTIRREYFYCQLLMVEKHII